MTYAAMCTLSLYDVIRITRHLHIKFKSFSNLYTNKQHVAVHTLYTIAKKTVIMTAFCWRLIP